MLASPFASLVFHLSFAAEGLHPSLRIKAPSLYATEASLARREASVFRVCSLLLQLFPRRSIQLEHPSWNTTPHGVPFAFWAEDLMAGPPNDLAEDTAMVEVLTTSSTGGAPMTGADDENDNLFIRQRPPGTATTNGRGPVVISMSQDEYTTRTSREMILQRLSEALLRHSLTKVSRWFMRTLSCSEFLHEDWVIP